MLFGFAGAAVGYALLGVSQGVGLLALAVSVTAVGTGVLRPALTSLITQEVGRSEQGVVLGLNQSLMSVSQMLGPAIAGVLIDRRLLLEWALLAAFLMLAGFIASFRGLVQPAPGTGPPAS